MTTPPNSTLQIPHLVPRFPFCLSCTIGTFIPINYLTVKQQRLNRPATHLAQALRLIDELIAAIVALPRVPLAVLVSHHAANRLHNRRRHKVLAGNELQTLKAGEGGCQAGA